MALDPVSPWRNPHRVTRAHLGGLPGLLLCGLASAAIGGCGAERAPSASAPPSTAAPAAAPPPPPPATPAAAASSGAYYATIEDAQRELAEAERKLTVAGERQARRTITTEQKPTEAQAQERGIGGQQTPGRSGQQAGPRQQAPAKAGARKEAPAAPAPAQADRGGDAVAKDKNKKAEAGNDDEAELSESPCAVACRALTSMKRAADAVCRLAGEGDARCADARKRVSESATRVASCACEPLGAGAREDEDARTRGAGVRENEDART